LREFLADLERGPSAAFVERVDTRWLPANSSFHGFEVRF
jgi:hypothetical protein